MASKMADYINNVEIRWLPLLYGHCKKRFQQIKLPSHDHFHHLRVWHIAKDLLHELQSYHTFSEHDVEKILVAIFFHDIGMAVETDEQHGRRGKQMCEAFFTNHPFSRSPGFEEVLHAIEQHDNKEYSEKHSQNERLRTSLLSILCVCDDLDAFGAIGVFRYAEIYLLRNILFKDIAGKILTNIDHRYKNFSRIYGHLQAFITYHTPRYHLIKNFYHDLEAQHLTLSYPHEEGSGPMGVFNYLVKYLIHGETSLPEISYRVLAESKDPYVKRFFTIFQQELERDRQNVRKYARLVS